MLRLSPLQWPGLWGKLGMWVRVAFAIALLLLPSAGCALGEKRIALLIGNQSYSAKIGALKNPHADIALSQVLVRP